MSDKDRLDTGMQRNSSTRAVALLVGGTASAHAITALALLALSRLYSPVDFSALAVFSSVLSIIAVAACLRFDVAVPIPERDTDAVNLLGLALGCAMGVSILVAIPVLLVPERIADWLNQPVLMHYLWLLPLGVFLAGSYSALQGWFVRRKAFGQIARSRVAQSAASAGTQVGMGLAGISPFGLLLGYVMNMGMACIMLGFRLFKFERATLRTMTWSGMRSMAVEHHRFPKYSALEALSNSAAIQLPIIIIAAVAVGPEAGYLTLAMYVMQAPMALVGTAIGQVYLSRAPDEYRAGHLGIFTAGVFGKLLKAGAGPLIFIGIVSPVAFPLVFGEEWRRAGHLVSWMTPWFLLQFVASPISMVLHVTGNQATALALQVFGFVFRIVVVWGAAIAAKNFVSEAYAISGFVFYLVYVAVVFRIVSARSMDIRRSILECLPHLLMWIVPGIGMKLVISSIFF